MIGLLLLLTGCGSDKKEVGLKSIDVKSVYKIVENYEDYNNVYIVDVREPMEFEEGHIPHSINIPLSELDRIDLDKDAKVIVYCRSGNRSKAAIERLNDLGYENLANLGGILDWPYEIEK